MFWFRSVKVSTDPDIPGELHAGHEISNENVPLLHDLHVKEVCERLGVEDGNDVRVNISEERERGRDVGAENRALVLLYSLPEELLGALEPEVV